MFKKLQLNEFIASLDSKVDLPLSKKINTIIPELTIDIESFYSKIENHTGIFYINEVKYENLLASSANLYFYNMLNESIDNQFMIFYDPILDIKQKEDNKYIIFYYPDTILNIRLDTNG